MIRRTYMALGFWMMTNAVAIYTPMIPQAQQAIPAYAKWGQFAMKETQSNYPNAKIIDYLHEGSELQGDSTIEKFKLWLKEGNHEFGVFVRIEYTTKNEKVVSITFEETDR